MPLKTPFIIVISDNSGFVFEDSIVRSYGIAENCPYCGQRDCYNNCDESQYNNELETESEVESRRDYNKAIDGVESLLLAMTEEDIDIRTEAVKKAIVTALDAIANNT